MSVAAAVRALRADACQSRLDSHYTYGGAKPPGRVIIASHRVFGRWSVMLRMQYDGDKYGATGSDSTTFSLTITRNPK